MNTIPKKYLSARLGNESIHLMRKWIGKYGELLIMECLLKAYADAKTVDKTHIGIILSMLFDVRSKEFAMDCANMFGFDPQPSLSVGESILVNRIKSGYNVAWLKEFSQLVSHWAPLVEEFDSEKYPLIFTPESASKVVCINKEDGIYAFRSIEGSVNIVVINTKQDDILVDEESFGDDEYPLYFTESSHFVSPVFRLRVVSRLLEFILAEIGYPTFKIKHSVVFNAHNAMLINSSEYESGGNNESDWQNISVYMRKDYPNNYIFSSASHFLPGDEIECIENDVATKLIEALAAVSILYSNLSEDKKLLSTSTKELQKYAKKCSIFSDVKDA